MIAPLDRAAIAALTPRLDGLADPADPDALLRLLRLARIGCNEIFAAQDRAIGA